MATIMLDKSESFEHFHTHPSTTVLQAGQVRLLMNGAVLNLQRGVPVAVPANISHTMVNVGEGTAVISCVH